MYDQGMAMTYCRPVKHPRRKRRRKTAGFGKEKVPNDITRMERLAVCDGSTSLISVGRGHRGGHNILAGFARQRGRIMHDHE